MLTVRNIDPEIASVLEDSIIDGLAAHEWLDSDDVSDVRKACLFNVLAVLCVTPYTSEPLIDYVISVFTVKDDRVGLCVESNMRDQLDDLVADYRLPVYADRGKPLGIHRDMIKGVPQPEDREVFKDARLSSYRAEGSPSLQIVIADSPREYTYADVDLDGHNPLQDVVGFVGHMWELVRGRRGKKTDHLQLRAVLERGTAAPYLAYTLTPDGGALNAAKPERPKYWL